LYLFPKKWPISCGDTPGKKANIKIYVTITIGYEYLKEVKALGN
jgi:hypothetical protein